VRKWKIGVFCFVFLDIIFFLYFFAIGDVQKLRIRKKGTQTSTPRVGLDFNEIFKKVQRFFIRYCIQHKSLRNDNLAEPVEKWTIGGIQSKVTASQKIPLIPLVVKGYGVQAQGHNSFVTLKDPTGEIKGSVHRLALDKFGTEFIDGAIIVLEDVRDFFFLARMSAKLTRDWCCHGDVFIFCFFSSDHCVLPEPKLAPPYHHAADHSICYSHVQTIVNNLSHSSTPSASASFHFTATSTKPSKECTTVRATTFSSLNIIIVYTTCEHDGCSHFIVINLTSAQSTPSYCCSCQSFSVEQCPANSESG
jgi:hypothetical protein